jgi:hypothetical protein
MKWLQPQRKSKYHCISSSIKELEKYLQRRERENKKCKAQ